MAIRIALALIALSASPLQAFSPCSLRVLSHMGETPSGFCPFSARPAALHSPLQLRPFADLGKRTASAVAGGIRMAETTGNKRVFLGGLPFKATEEDVREVFEPCGKIASVDIRMNADGRPAGYAFMMFEEADSLPKALELDGVEMMGRWIKVQEADGSKKARKKTVKPEGCKKVFVWNVPYSVEEEEVKEFFSECGEVVDVLIPIDEASGRIKGHCFVQFTETEATDKALELNGRPMGGREVKVDYATSRGRGGK